MERKIKFGLSVLLILGIVFASVGGVYLLVAIGVGLSGVSAAEPEFPVVFGSLSVVFLVMGLAFLFLEFFKRRQIRALVQSGKYVWGVITKVDTVFNVRINSRHPQVAVVAYQYGGQTHYFTSRYLPRYFPDTLVGQQVKLYCNVPQFKPYYVDMEPLLQNQIMH